ncbi:MAG: hypothetical protein NWQ46_10505, partial [Spirosomaceae bacterium]|nr:hypothetical protein [Spirosomataceae bacterium]
RHYFNVPRDKIHENPDKGFTRSLIIRYYQGGKVAKTMIIPITVLGGFTQRESIGPGPLELKFVLRAPPGDASFSYIEKGQENSSEVVASATQSSSKTKTTTIKSEVGFEAASGFGGSASSTLEMKTSTTRERGETNQTKFTVTTEDRIENKTGSDMFLFERNQYFYDKDFSVKAFFTNSGKVQMELQSKIVLRYVKKLQDVYVYENKIRSDSIPLYTATNQPKKAKFWQDVLALNKRAKENPVNIRPAQININNKEGRYIRENASAFTLSESLAITEGISIEVEGGISTPVSSVSVSQKTEYEFTTTNSTDKTQAAASRFTVGYYVEDTSPGDVINMQIADDPVFGMPIFKLASTSRTSCPFQPGTIQRDRPLITVENPKKADEFLDSAKYSDIESGKEVAFLVKVKNNSDSKETRIYRLRKFGERLPSMEYDQDEFALEYGQEKEFDVYVRNRRDIDVGYDNIFLVVEPRCNIAYYDGEGRFDDGYISDTIKLAAYWGATDKDRAPDNDDIETALLIPSDGRLVSTYKNIFGSDSKVSNRNATTFAGEQSLVPPTDCQKGWCAETTDGKPEITNSVWFKFVVNSLDAAISTCDPMNNGFNSQMAVFKIQNIADPASYVRLGANDKDFCRGNDNSTVTLNNLTLGDTLYILIDGNKAAQADFGISVKSLPPLGDDECSEIRLTVSGKSSGRYSNISGTVSERENDLVANIPNDYFSGWKNDSIQHSAWFMFVAPDGGEVIIDVLNATFDTQMAVFQAAACGDPAYFRQWTFMGANDDITSLGGLNSQLFLKGLEKGKPYKILVDGHNGAMGFFDMKLTIPTPANDEPINAIALQIDAAGQGVFSNGGATSPDAEQVIAPPVVELNKPGGWSDKENDPRARRIERSVWFKFVAPSEGAVKISTCDQENFFVQLAVYKVGNLLDYSTFELIEADDESQFCRRPPSNESPNGRNIRGSIIELTGLTPDSTYYLVVDGSVNSFGQFSIDLLTTPSDPPINDEACKAIELAVDGEVKKG